MQKQVVGPRPVGGDWLQDKTEYKDRHGMSGLCIMLESNITQEATRMKMNILGLAEVTWVESWNLQCDSHTLIYSEHKKECKHGVGQCLSQTEYYS